LKGDECVVDIDIDDAGGLEHVQGENKFTGPTTFAFTIFEVSETDPVQIRRLRAERVMLSNLLSKRHCAFVIVAYLRVTRF
jgi:hypothetical protein